MTPSELAQVWQHFILRNSSKFTVIEIRDVSGEVLRGPISGMVVEAEKLIMTIRTEWTIRRPKNSNQWQSLPDFITHHILDEHASEPQAQSDGSVYFRSSFQDNYLYPANHAVARGLKKP